MPEWTKKRARQGSRRRLERIDRSLHELSYNWGELDQYVVDLVDEILEKTDELREAMNESVQLDEKEEQESQE